MPGTRPADASPPTSDSAVMVKGNSNVVDRLEMVNDWLRENTKQASLAGLPNSPVLPHRGTRQCP